MNFVAHLAVARRYGMSAEFWLGAMLPDLAGMVGVRLPAPRDLVPATSLARGVAHHHGADEAFHGADGFVTLVREGVEALTEAGVPRGSARAVAHVGVELLLDGELGDDLTLVADYRAALAVPFHGVAALVGEPARAAPLAAIVARLADHGFPFEYRDAHQVAARVVRILAARPRLAVPEAAIPGLTRVLVALQGRVRSRAAALVDAVHAGLHRRADAHNEG